MFKIKFVSVNYDASKVAVAFKISGENLPLNITETTYRMDLGLCSQQEVLRHVEDFARKTIQSINPLMRADFDQLKDKEFEIND